MKRGKNHVSWNENPPETAAQVVAEGLAAATGKSNTADGEDSTKSPAGDKAKNPKKSVNNSEEFEEMKKKLQKLKEEERQVDQYLEYLKEQAAIYNGHQPPSREQLVYLPNGVTNVPEQMYVKFEDITSMPAYKSETVIGIRAPTGTSLEVPDPDDGMKPGERRYEMYLNSKGTEHPSMRESSANKGEPINVYLVQPTADKQGSTQEGNNAPGFVPNDESPSPQRSSKAARGEDSSKLGGKTETADQQEQGPYRPPPHGHPGHHIYDMPPPPGHGPDYGAERSQYPPHGEPSWGPGPYGHGTTPPGYYSHPPHRDHRYQGPDLEREGEPHEGRPSSDRREAFRSSAHQYHHPHEMGRTESSGGDIPPGRPPSPSSQQNQLLTMPLQSPSGHHFPHFTSPSGHGFTPPPGGTPRSRVRSGDPEEFPILQLLPNESGGSREFTEQWQPPRPKLSKGPQGARR